MPQSKNKQTIYRAVLATGVVFVAVACAANLIGLTTGPVGKDRLMLGGTGIVFVLIGLLRSHALRLYRFAAITILNCAVLLICLEIGATFLHRVTPAQRGHIASAASSSVKREMYVGWRGRPFHEETVTIEESGCRATRPVLTEPVDLQIFAFGGSTMWGEGASDYETIPAWLQRKLASRLSINAGITNFGQCGWVSTQGLVELVTQLRLGNVPDLVVFYDGYNETTAAYSTGGRIGMPENYNGLTSEPSLQSSLIAASKKTDLMRLIQTRVLPNRRRIQNLPADSGTIASQVIANYRAVHDVVLGLGREHGFAVQFYWQPQIYRDPKTLTAEEQQIVDSHPWLPGPVKALFDETYPRARQLAAEVETITDISHALEPLSEHVYIDPCHITGVGNEHVVDMMLDRNLEQTVKEVMVRKGITTASVD